MLLRNWLPQALTALFGGLFVCLAIVTFGEPLYFDRLYIGLLIFTAVVCRRNVNVVGVIAILLAERLVEEFLWWRVGDSVAEEAATYLILALLYFRLRYDPMAKVAIATLVISVAAELKWLVSGYADAPQIYWYNIIIGQNMLVRYFIFSRVELTEKLTGKEAESIHLDWFVYQITRVYMVFNLLMVLEYLLRHMAGFHSITYFYDFYSIALQAVGTFTLYIVFHETNKLLQARLLRA